MKTKTVCLFVLLMFLTAQAAPLSFAEDPALTTAPPAGSGPTVAAGSSPTGSTNSTPSGTLMPASGTLSPATTTTTAAYSYTDPTDGTVYTGTVETTITAGKPGWIKKYKATTGSDSTANRTITLTTPPFNVQETTYIRGGLSRTEEFDGFNTTFYIGERWLSDRRVWEVNPFTSIPLGGGVILTNSRGSDVNEKTWIIDVVGNGRYTGAETLSTKARNAYELNLIHPNGMTQNVTYDNEETWDGTSSRLGPFKTTRRDISTQFASGKKIVETTIFVQQLNGDFTDTRITAEYYLYQDGKVRFDRFKGETKDQTGNIIKSIEANWGGAPPNYTQLGWQVVNRTGFTSDEDAVTWFLTQLYGN